MTSDATGATGDAQLDKDIETALWNATNQIDVRDQSDLVRRLLPVALRFLLIVPVLAVLIQMLRWWTSSGAGGEFGWIAWTVAALVLPAAFLFARLARWKSKVVRQQALRAVDEELGSKDRIVTADQFLQIPSRDGFMQAAIDDAATWAQRGGNASIGVARENSMRWVQFWPVPVAMLLFVFAATLAGRDYSVSNMESDGDTVALVGDVSQSAEMTPVSTPVTPDALAPPEARPRGERPPRKQRTVNRRGEANSAIPDNAEESQGKLDDGETRESQQSANPSSARGVPSASGQPSEPGDPKDPKKKKKPKKLSEKERKKKPQPQDDKPSGATAGQGSSKGSDNNAAPSDWASLSQAATPDDQDAEEEDEVDDEEEEQESRGGVQPNLRDRRTPVNRDLQIGFGNARPNPDANGRGGPGGQKKSRGVASLVLGVPIPDRVNGQPNKGRIRITQQRITPEAEESDAMAAQQRATRQGPVGPVSHPLLSPWLRDHVRQYFLNRRAKHPLDTPNSVDADGTDGATPQTTRVNTSKSPQS